MVKILGIIVLLISGLGLASLLYAKRKPFKLGDVDLDFSTKKTLQFIGCALAGILVGGILFLEGYIAEVNASVPLLSRILSYISLVVLFASIASYFTTSWLETKKVIEEEKKIEKLHLLQVMSVFMGILAFIFMLQGVVTLLTFPLRDNLIKFNDNLDIKLYAVCIFVGALVAYYTAVRKFIKLGYPRNFLENLFYVALPAGIVGARLWYVIAEWPQFSDDLSSIINMRDGGLAIQGGVLLGAAVGIYFMHKTGRLKQINILHCADLIVPGILLAQAIGRWGNFFNVEVYGASVARSGWEFLPSVILNQMVDTSVSVDNIFVPLFLIEAVLNVIGYFVIVHLVGKLLKKHLVIGDLALMYFIWYGTVRAIMEPIRDPKYIMGSDNLISQNLSFIFVACGILGIVLLHYFKKKKPELFVMKTPDGQTIKDEEVIKGE